MSIKLDARTFRRLTDAVMPGERLAPREAITVALIAQLAAGVDLDDDAAESGLLDAVIRNLCAFAGIPRSSVPVLSPRPLPKDVEGRSAWVNWLAGQLVTTEARELALVVAHLVIVADLELAPVEMKLGEELRRALSIDVQRARDLIAEVMEAVTPGIPGELRDAAHP
jgi:hypothetical protein